MLYTLAGYCAVLVALDFCRSRLDGLVQECSRKQHSIDSARIFSFSGQENNLGTADLYNVVSEHLYSDIGSKEGVRNAFHEEVRWSAINREQLLLPACATAAVQAAR